MILVYSVHFNTRVTELCKTAKKAEMDIRKNHFFNLYSIQAFSQNPMMNVSTNRNNNGVFMAHVYVVYNG